MANDIQFPKGIYYNEPHANAPDFVVCNISIQKEQLTNWLIEQEVDEKGYLKLDVKKSKEGKVYMAVNTWKSDNKPF